MLTEVLIAAAMETDDIYALNLMLESGAEPNFDEAWRERATR